MKSGCALKKFIYVVISYIFYIYYSSHSLFREKNAP